MSTGISALYLSLENTTVMLPTDNSKLLMRWKGPYVVSERVGLTDYRIQMGNRLKVFHINNMLKQYTQRLPFEVGAAMSFVDVVPDDDVAETVEFCPSAESGDDVVLASTLTSSQLRELKELVGRYPDIFSDKPGNTTLVEHSNELTDARPVWVKHYKFPFAKINMVKEEIKQMLQMDVIEPSNSPYCAPLLLVRKRDDTFRPVIDFRQLNRITRFDSEPIPNPDEIFAKLAGKCYFSKLDFFKGYWQIEMSAEDKEKTAFAAPNGLFHFRRMPFGLVNSGATYTRMVRILLAGLENVDNYIDDVLIHSDSWESHLATPEQLFASVRDANLTVKPSKCRWAVSLWVTSSQMVV